MRGLIRPEPGTALVYLDYEQQEFGIAAALSGDGNMMDAYRSGDPYLAFARQAGAVPPGATRDTHGPARDQFKTCALGIQYAMGAEALAHRLATASSRGRELLNLHRQTYPDYWRWSEACVAHAMLHGHLTATFGWRVHVGPDTRPTTLRNFLLQANGAEMLRLACVLAHERGLPVCCPVHDALLVEAPASALDGTVAQTQQAMREASELVLPGFPLRTEAKVIRWPERFADKRGRLMWEVVWELIGQVEATPRAPEVSHRRDTSCATAGLFPVPPAGHPLSLMSVCSLSPVAPCPMNDPDFDSDRLRIDPATVDGWLKNSRRRKPVPTRPARKGKFLRGPVPLAWLRRAAELPGKGLAVGLALWFLRGVRKRWTVRLTRRTLLRFGVGRKPGYLGLKYLEAAGLVRVRRHVGKSPVVTILFPQRREGSTAD